MRPYAPLIEDLPLGYAAHRVIGALEPMSSPLVTACVLLGSAGALFKWLLILLSVAGIVVELGSGPRGAVLWRVRYSALAVLLCGVPILAVSQGQDILQRVFEGEHAVWRFLLAVPPPIVAALAIWYCGRKLLELKLDARSRRYRRDGWYDFFAVNIPRALGIALLALVGTAFARAGLATTRYLLITAIAFLVPLASRRRWHTTFARVGQRLLAWCPTWRAIPRLDEELVRLLLAAVIGIAAFWPRLSGDSVRSPFGDPDEVGDRTLLDLRIAGYLCLVAGWAFHLYVKHRREARNVKVQNVLARQASGLPPPRRSVAPMPAKPVIESVNVRAVGVDLQRQVVAAAILSVACLIAFTRYPVVTGRAIGPLWVLSVATANAVFLGSVAVWAGKRFRFPVVAAALLLSLLFSLWNDNHAVRTITASKMQVQSRPSLDADFDDWKRDLEVPGAGDTLPVVLVAAAGGGLRAAYWTAMSLAVIQDRAPAFGRHVFAFSGVSGGSLGGALFAALLRDAGSNAQLGCAPSEGHLRPGLSGPFVTCVHDFMDDDYLSPVLAKLLAPDLLQVFLPLPVAEFDRGKALEESWEASYALTTGRPTFEQGFAAFTADATMRSRVPILLLNATHVESGRRYIASSVVRKSGEKAAHSFEDAADVLDVLHADIRMSTAIHNSARFTYISPAGHLDSGDGVEHGCVVDGGYFENSGLATLREVYDVVRERGISPYVLYLCNDPMSCDSEGSTRDAVPSTAADEVLSPVRALYNTRDARGSLARESLRRLAGERFVQLNVCSTPLPLSPSQTNSPEEVTARERVVSPPLGWVLSKLARDWMDASLLGASPNDAGSCYQRNSQVIDTLQKALGAASLPIAGPSEGTRAISASSPKARH